eukprot:m.753581 g.753581  ORF g.753581 m.753581 type:complete len:234 (-) comp23172_c0_seq5:97-798(-)
MIQIQAIRLQHRKTPQWMPMFYDNGTHTARLTPSQHIYSCMVCMVCRCTRLDDENQLLRREVAALTDEVSSYMTRVRSTQDALSDTREALAASERKLTRAHSAKREFIEREDTLQRAADTAAAAARELEEKLAGQEQMLVDLRAEKDMLLQDHADASHAHNHALSALRAELEALQASKADTHGSLEASRTEAEDNLRRLRDEHAAQTAELSSTASTTTIAISLVQQLHWNTAR